MKIHVLFTDHGYDSMVIHGVTANADLAGKWKKLGDFGAAEFELEEISEPAFMGSREQEHWDKLFPKDK